MSSMTPIKWLGGHAGKIALVAALAIPAGVAVMDSAVPNAENRNLSPLPARPASWPAVLAAPAQLNAWVNDHFGFRNDLVRMNNWLRFKLFREFPSIQMAAGRHGRYFLAAHGTNVPPFQAIMNVCGNMGKASPGTAAYMSKMFADFHAMGLQPKLMIVPSTPVVYSQDLPVWLVRQCAAPRTPVSAVLESPELSAEARANIWFPLQEMRDIGKTASLFPLTWFHWGGPGLDQVARQSITHFWQRPLDVAPPLKTRVETVPSDVSHLFTGIDLPSTIIQPDTPASQIKTCYNGTCFPEIAAASAILSDVSRFENPLAPRRRLLIISDSFGAKVSAWYARYYGTVEQFATNNIERLTPEQTLELKTFLFRDPDHTDILFMYHDGGAIYDILKIGLRRLHESPQG